MSLLSECFPANILSLSPGLPPWHFRNTVHAPALSTLPQSLESIRGWYFFSIIRLPPHPMFLKIITEKLPMFSGNMKPKIKETRSV